MDIRSLKHSTYVRLSQNRPEVLQKNRGYGIVYLTINTLIYAIPLRSNMNHSSGFKTIYLKDKGYWCGLDYTKALIVGINDIELTAFKLREQKEFDKIQKNKEKIKAEFEKYVEGYIQSVKDKTNTTEKRFKFSTLQYFHTELCLQSE